MQIVHGKNRRALTVHLQGETKSNKGFWLNPKWKRWSVFAEVTRAVWVNSRLLDILWHSYEWTLFITGLVMWPAHTHSLGRSRYSSRFYGAFSCWLTHSRNGDRLLVRVVLATTTRLLSRRIKRSSTLLLFLHLQWSSKRCCENALSAHKQRWPLPLLDLLSIADSWWPKWGNPHYLRVSTSGEHSRSFAQRTWLIS